MQRRPNAAVRQRREPSGLCFGVERIDVGPNRLHEDDVRQAADDQARSETPLRRLHGQQLERGLQQMCAVLVHADMQERRQQVQ